MGILTLLDQARSSGLTVHVLDGRLVIRGPKSAAPLVEVLASRKAEVIDALSESDDVTPPDSASEPADWPASWAGDFDQMASENERIGYLPGEAAALAYRVLEARASAPWRAVLVAWSIERRQRWGDRAGELQDSGLDWLEAEKVAFGEIAQEEFSALRWGPAVGDPEPGIVIDRPQRSRTTAGTSPAVEPTASGAPTAATTADDDDPDEGEHLGTLANNGMTVWMIRNSLEHEEGHANSLRDLFPRVIAEGMWRDFILVDGSVHHFGAADFRKFLECPWPQGGCQSSIPVIERMIGGTDAWEAVRAALEGGRDDEPTASHDAVRVVANGEAIRKLRMALSNAEYVRTTQKMFLRMAKEGSWRKYLTRDDRDEVKVHRRGAADFRAFLEAPGPAGLQSSVAFLERVLRGTDAWPVYQELIGASAPPIESSGPPPTRGASRSGEESHR